MALRRKPKRSREVAALSKLDATPPWETRVRSEPAATSGPFDERDAPEDDDVTRADLGSLRIPVSDGFDLQVEVDESQHVVSATLTGADGSMQLGLFAAPRNEGLWDDVRAEMAAALKEQRGNPKEHPDGTFGTELHATLPADVGRVPVRFVGVDGPRWLLRATFVGAPADPGNAQKFEDLLRQVIVVRGSDPLPAREAVPLSLPKDVVLPGEQDE